MSDWQRRLRARERQSNNGRNETFVYVHGDESVSIDTETKCYGVDEDGDVLLSAHCPHVLGFPLDKLRGMVNDHGDKAVLAFTCPDCSGRTLVRIAPIIESVS